MSHLFSTHHLSEGSIPIVDPVIYLLFACLTHLPSLFLKLNSDPIERIVLRHLFALSDLKVKWNTIDNLFAWQLVFFYREL